MNTIVIDDFYSQPEQVRMLALKAQYRDVSQLNYPGYQSLRSYESQEVRRQFENILGRELEIDPVKLTFGPFRIMLTETASQLKVHLDGMADWTGVLYLNPNANDQGGTGFYRHKRTGLEGRPKPAELAKFGFANMKEFEEMLKVDSYNSTAWEQTSVVGMKFNRLVLFKGNELFHCHTRSFGKDKIDGRMTQNFFFNEKSPSKLGSQL